MEWRDIALMLAGWLFAPALIPMLRSRSKPPILSSGLTGTGLLIVLAVNASLGWWLASASTALALLCRVVLFAQRIGQTGRLERSVGGLI